jgi:hypothetical protein
MPYYTYHKYKGAHHYVCVYVLSHCSVEWMPYYTLQKYKGAHHYVCVDVLSVYCFYECLITHITSIMALTTMCAFMCYQTHLLTEDLLTHFTRTLITMDALMCYQTPLMTVCPITHFTCMWTLTPMYITGISAFNTVYMMLFIQSTLVNKQRLNINPLTPELNPSEQRCLPEFFTGDFKF